MALSTAIASTELKHIAVEKFIHMIPIFSRTFKSHVLFSFFKIYMAFLSQLHHLPTIVLPHHLPHSSKTHLATNSNSFYSNMVSPSFPTKKGKGRKRSPSSRNRFLQWPWTWPWLLIIAPPAVTVQAKGQSLQTRSFPTRQNYHLHHHPLE